MQFMYSPQNNYNDVLTHMNLVCFYHSNITYSRIIRLIKKYSYPINYNVLNIICYAILSDLIRVKTFIFSQN